MVLHEFVIGIKDTIILFFSFLLEIGSNIHCNNRFINLAFLHNHEVEHILKRNDIIMIQKTVVAMQLQDSLSYNGLKTTHVQLMLFKQSVYSTKNQQFTENWKRMRVSGSIASNIFSWKVVVNDPFMSSERNDFGGFYLKEWVPKKCPTLFSGI